MAHPAGGRLGGGARAEEEGHPRARPDGAGGGLVAVVNRMLGIGVFRSTTA